MLEHVWTPRALGPPDPGPASLGIRQAASLDSCPASHRRQHGTFNGLKVAPLPLLSRNLGQQEPPPSAQHSRTICVKSLIPVAPSLGSLNQEKSKRKRPETKGSPSQKLGGRMFVCTCMCHVGCARVHECVLAACGCGCTCAV